MAAGIVVFAAALVAFHRSAPQLESRGDEWLYIHMSRYFANVYTGGGLANPEWDDGYWSHLQPMMLPYAIGAWLTVQGYNLYQMPAPLLPRSAHTQYQVPVQRASYETGRDNFLVGPVPDKELLGDARALMAFLAAGVALCVYLVGRVSAGPVAGVSAVALLLARPLFSQELVWVQTESLLMLLVLLALLLAIFGARHDSGGGLPVRWAIPLGIALGLAFGTKLTAVLSLSAVAAWMLTVAIAAALRNTDRFIAGFRAARGWLLALAVALSVFTLSNPHLYTNPIVHTGHLFETHAGSMERSAARSAEGALPTLAERVNFVVRGSLVGVNATGSQETLLKKGAGLGIAGAALVGFVALSFRALKAFRDRRVTRTDAAIVFLTVLVYFAGVSAGMGFGLARYLVPTAVLGTVLCGVGIATLVQAMGSAAVRAAKLTELVARAGDRALERAR